MTQHPPLFYAQYLHQWQQHQKAQRHRSLIVLQGESPWQQAIWQALCRHHTPDNCLQLGGAPHPTLYRTLSSQQTRHLLGQEAQLAFLSAYHADAGIDPDALGILSGLLTAGGLCIIGLPPENEWTHFPNPASLKYLNTPHTANTLKHGFNAFLTQTLRHPDTLWLQQNTPPSPPELYTQKTPTLADPPILPSKLTPNPEQQQAITLIKKVATGHRHRPLLLTADRGRGKSTALGFAIAHLLQLGKRHIGLTAARKAQAQIVFNTLQTLLDQQHIPYQFHSNTLTATLPSGQASVQFYAPDALIASPPTLDILFVEEAAHLPLPMLTKLLERFSRIVFATTLHGYEGSGRGFSLRFTQLLQQHCNRWFQHTLKTPIRWAPNDPLEHFIQRLYLQTPSPSFPPHHPPHPLILHNETPDQLWQTPTKLTAIFQLLVEAHYQTRPNDLLQLLDAPDLKLWTAWQADRLIGVLLIIEEGHLPPPTPTNTRPYHGHLVPQQLYTQSLHPDWLTLKSWRIMRLAVSPRNQNQGIGTQLVQHALQQASKEAIDFVSTSFGATPELIRFWQKSAFTPLYLGLKQDKASASHALTLAHPLSPTAQTLIQEQLTHYHPQFADLLSRTFQHLDPDLLLALLNAFHYPRQKLPTGYLNGQPFEAISHQLKQWALSHPTDIQTWPYDLRHAFIRLVCQHQTGPLNQHSTTYPHRKALEAKFKKKLSWHI